MKIRRTFSMAVVLVLAASMFTGCMMMTPVRTASTGSYENPQWAPPYYSGARYYYLPDLELYYDLSTRDYIYLMDGQWNFSPNVPAMYRNYELDNCFCVVMDVNVYKPWLHHQYYISHYPRYYYRDYYDHSNIPYVRAYNENLQKAIYWNQNERQRARPYDDVNLRDNRRFKYSKDDRKEQKVWTRPETKTNSRPANNNARPVDTNSRPANNNARPVDTNTRPTNTREEAPEVRNNRTNYYGRTIGTSVKVTKEMKDKPATPARTTTTTTTRKTRATSSDR